MLTSIILILLSTCLMLVASEDKMRKSVVDVCSLSRRTGNCRAIIPAWYFDKSNGTCQSFDYSGCGGNANNFESLALCEEKCVAVKKGCMMKKDSGKCRAAIRAWYYDASSGGCKRFAYGGCGGNGNNFKSQNLCEIACVRRTKV